MVLIDFKVVIDQKMQSLMFLFGFIGIEEAIVCLNELLEDSSGCSIRSKNRG